MLWKRLLLLSARYASSDITGSAAMKGLPRKWAIPGVEHIVAVASGKGGVGKSTTAGSVIKFFLC